MRRYLRYAEENRSKIAELIREMVECESPSDSRAGVNRLLDLIVERTADIAIPKRVRSKHFGDHLRLDFRLPGRKKTGQFLALGHSDTVWPLGTLAQMPFRNSKGRLWGPGVLDMKSGLAFFIYAVRTLFDLDVEVDSRVVLWVVSDEEVGSPDSRALTEEQAKRSCTVLVLEPGTGLDGKLKTSRKGVGRYVISVKGKAAHAGVDFERGASAIVEAAKQIETIAALTDLRRGITLNPGTITGGTRSNVVADHAWIELDVRVVSSKDARQVDKKLKALKPRDRRCEVHVEGGLNRPPMERTKSIRSLFAHAREIGREIGVTLDESSTGGGSDGNFTAALGIPTLDGLGGVGEGAHAANESILVDRIPDRVALLAGLVSRL